MLGTIKQSQKEKQLGIKGLCIVSYMTQHGDVDKFLWVWYKDGLMTFYTSNDLSNFIEYEHNKEETKCKR